MARIQTLTLLIISLILAVSAITNANPPPGSLPIDHPDNNLHSLVTAFPKLEDKGSDHLKLVDVLGVQIISTEAFIKGGAQVQEAGARFVHLGIEWRWLSDNKKRITPDRYDWTSFDNALTKAATLGFQVIITLGGNPYWAADFNRGPINKVPIEEFIDYVTAVVTRYSQQPYNVEYWAFYNEPDIVSFDVGAEHREAFGDHPQEYVNTLQVGYKTVKEINPNAKVLLGGVAYDWFTDKGGVFNPNFLDEIFTLGAANYFDYMNFHYYPDFDERWEKLTGKPGLTGKISEILRIMANHGVDRPVVCTELGDSSGGIFPGDDRTRDTQGRAVIQYFTRAIASGVVIGIWYNMNDCEGEGDGFRNHGLLNTRYQPKPSLTAFHNLRTHFNASSFLRSMEETEWGATSIEGYVFRNQYGWKDTAILWAADGNNQTITLPPNTMAVEDQYGQTMHFDETLRIGKDPVFVSYIVPDSFVERKMK